VSAGRRRRERGVVLVVVALTMVAVLITAALVLDLGLVRQNRQADKSATDFAAAAGIRALETPAGVPQPWKGVCTARDYLVANNRELAGMTGTYTNGDGTATYTTDPCASTGVAPYTTLCTDHASSWAVFRGSVDGGRVQVTIASGYRLGTDPRFPEDSNASYASDTGRAALGGCDQLAVIVEEGEAALFGGAAGATGYDSVVRSVARLELGTLGDATAALLLLERNDCRALSIGGTSGAKVIIEGSGDNPGIIHTDSLGNGSDCAPADPQNGNILQVDGNPPDPRIVVRRASLPVGDEAAGMLSMVALSGATGANPADAASPWPAEVCAQRTATDCATTAPITGSGPTGADLIGRGHLDRRYRQPIIGLRDEAQTRFAWNDPTDLPAGWTAVACNDPGPFTAARIWVDCAGGEFDGNNKTFAASVDDIVINGYVVVDGGGSTLRFTSPDTLYIRGHGSNDAVSLTGTGNNIFVNDGGLTDGDGDGFVCDERFASAPSARTELVVGSGPILGEGGSGKVLRLCQTVVFMMDDSGSPACPVPTVDGVAPYDNGCRGRLRVAGNNKLDWSAPNANNVTSPTRAQLDEFEDLAFWSETQGSAGISSIEGGGGVRLSGIFFTPNADPFRVGGNGAYDIEDAQFITRKLEVAGNGTLLMRPDPQNALQVPVFGGFTLVR
jgi:hypothetical protein